MIASMMMAMMMIKREKKERKNEKSWSLAIWSREIPRWEAADEAR